MKKFLFSVFIILSFPLMTTTQAQTAALDTIKYNEIEVELNTPTGNLFGTLCLPKTDTTHLPLAIIISGSGPTDRNGNSKYLKSDAYKMLAHELALKNIATLRYDKRGVGESESALRNIEELTFDLLVADALAWIDKYSKNNRFSKIIVIGHSQGSLVGILAAQKSSISTFISIAGLGEKGNVILKKQLAAQPKVIQDMAYPIIDTLMAGKLVDSVPEILISIFKPSGQPFLMSWFKYNPCEEIQKLTIPILIIQGTNDIQVEVEDARMLASSNLKAKLELIADMNHILKIVIGDRNENLATYSNLDLPISEELVSKINRFITNEK